MSATGSLIKNGILLCAAGAVLLLAGTGCGTASYRQDGSLVRHHFGYVRVISPPTASSSGQFDVVELSTVGVRFHKGAGLGWFHERTESIPLDSRLVIRVANEHQLQQVLQMLKPTEKDKLCVTVSP